MDSNRPAGVTFRHDGQGPNEDYHNYPSGFLTSSGDDQTMLTMPTVGHDLAVNGGATGHPFDQDPRFGHFLRQGGPIHDQQAYPVVPEGSPTNRSLEYDPPLLHAPPTGQGHRYLESFPNNSFMSEGARMHSMVPSSSSFPSEPMALAPASSQPSAATLSPFIPQGQTLLESFQSSIPAQNPPHAQTSSPLLALLSNGLGPSESDSIKLSDEKTEAIKALLLQNGWYAVPDEEPVINPDDPFVTQGLILRTDKTRFSAFVCFISNGGKTFCRIKHSVQTKKGPVRCTFSAVHPKDAIAHVCDYLNYKPYKCQGKGGHVECDSTYPTKERRNDHYAKKKKGPDSLEPCGECGTPITTRNVTRHRGTCLNTNKI